MTQKAFAVDTVTHLSCGIARLLSADGGWAHELGRIEEENENNSGLDAWLDRKLPLPFLSQAMPQSLAGILCRASVQKAVATEYMRHALGLRRPSPGCCSQNRPLYGTRNPQP